MVCTSLGSLLRHLFYFLCSILLIHRVHVQNAIHPQPNQPDKRILILRNRSISRPLPDFTSLNEMYLDSIATTSTTPASATVTTSSSQHGSSAVVASSSSNPDPAPKAQAAGVGGKSEDVYEFKSKDSAPAPSPTEATKVATAKDGKDSTAAVAASSLERGEKRPHSPDDDADGKRQKDNASPATSVGATSTAATAGAKGIRGTRGNSIDRSSSAKSSSAVKKVAVSGSDPNSRSNSAANSPRRAGDEASVGEGAAEQNSDAPKVPPLKISLTGGGNGGNSTQDKKDEAGDSPKADGDESGQDKGVSVDPSDGKSGSGTTSASAASRVTRSRANQGTPEATGSESAEPQNLSEQGAAANPATAAAAASSSSSVPAQPNNNANSSSSSNNSNDRSYEYQVKKRKLRSQVEDSSALPAAAAASAAMSAGTSGLSAGGPGNGNGGGGGCGASSNGNGASGVVTSSASAAVNLSSTGMPSSTSAAAGAAPTAAPAAVPSWREGEPTTDIEKFLKLRDQIKQRWRNIFPVQPKPPQGYKDYLMNKKTYLLEGNKHERLRAIPRIQPPPSLEGPLRQLFMEQVRVIGYRSLRLQ